MNEFVQSLSHPSPPPRWLWWMRQLLPPLCWKCGIVLGGKTYLDPASPFLCSDCLIGLPWTDPVYHCRQCGNLTAEPDRLRCEECLEDIWDLDESRSGFAYNDTIRHWILQLKFFLESNTYLRSWVDFWRSVSKTAHGLKNMIF